MTSLKPTPNWDECRGGGACEAQLDRLIADTARHRDIGKPGLTTKDTKEREGEQMRLDPSPKAHQRKAITGDELCKSFRILIEGNRGEARVGDRVIG